MSADHDRPPRSPIFHGPPPTAAGQRIGLYGGSFNPPHAAHAMVSRRALTRLGLDRVWWLVTPGNPLKDARSLAPLAERMAAAARIADDPRAVVTGLEARLGGRYTVDVLRALTRRRPEVRFVWIMGGDGLAQFHRWRSWREIAALAPIAVIERPGAQFSAPLGKAATALARYRRPEGEARILADLPAPAIVILRGPGSSLSSSALRNKSRAK